MSYKSHFDKELSYLPKLTFNEEQIAAAHRCLAHSAREGGSAGNLYALRDVVNTVAEIAMSDMEAKASLGESPDAEQLFSKNGIDYPELVAAIDVEKPVYRELIQFNLPTMARLIQCLIAAVTFRPFTPLQGTDDEWMSHGPGNSDQNKRFGSIFRDPETKEAYWLDRFAVEYPSQWHDFQAWSGHSRRGKISFPFNHEAQSQRIHYTDETLRLRMPVDKDPARQMITYLALAAASGQSIDPVVYRETEEITPHLAQLVEQATLDLWAHAELEIPELTYPHERHMQVLSDLRWASTYDSDQDEPEEVEVVGTSIPYALIPHIKRAIAMIPPGVVVRAGKFYSDAGDLRDGQFKALPVYHVKEDLSDWVKTELVSLRWDDVMTNETNVYHVTQDAGHVLVVAGDQSDWLWRMRDTLNIPHPKRDTRYDPVPDNNCDNPTAN